MSELEQSVQSQLDTFTANTGLVGLALANQDGLLIAGSGTQVNMEVMAAISPLAYDKIENRAEKIRTRLQERGLNFKIFDIKVGEQLLFLCATGEDQQLESTNLGSFLDQLAEQLVSRSVIDC